MTYPRNILHENGEDIGIFLTAKVLNNMWMIKALKKLNFTLKCSDFLQNIISQKSLTEFKPLLSCECHFSNSKCDTVHQHLYPPNAEFS